MQTLDLGPSRILIVDDEETNILLLERVLQRARYPNVLSTSDPTTFFDLCAGFRPDIILLDLRMPALDGYSILERLRAGQPPGDYLPVIVLTADATRDAKRRALQAGANDFLTKPFDTTEVVLRIQNLLETRALYRRLQEHNETLEARVRERTLQLERAQLEILERLARAAEFRDDATGQHALRVGRIAALLARTLELPSEQVETIRRAAPLHDIGKIGVPDRVLLKPGLLNAEERERMQTHTVIGGRLLSGSSFPILQMAQSIALTHHERWDGEGYPYGLRGETIPMVGRIAAVADVFDALVHERPYKLAWSFQDAVREIESQAGSQFDPVVVDEFTRILPDVVAIQGAPWPAG